MLTALGGNPAKIRHLELWLSTGDRSYARQTLAANGVGASQPLICLGVGATQAKRCWPIERFTGLAQWLAERYGARILVVGDAADARRAEQMRPLLGPALINQAGVCNVRQSAALVSLCGAFVGNDSGSHAPGGRLQNLPIIGLSCHPQTAPARPYQLAQAICAFVSLGARFAAGPRLPVNVRLVVIAGEAHCIANLELRNVQELFDELMSENIAYPCKQSDGRSLAAAEIV